MYRLIALALAMGGTQAVAASLEPLLPGCPYVETHELATLTPNSSRYQRFVTMVYRPDGRPVIAYAGGTSSEQSLHLILCDDVACTSRTDRELDTVFGYAAAPGLVLTSDGRPLLFADRFGTLRYYECHDTQCASFTPRTIETRSDRQRLVFAVTAQLANADGALRPGMPVEVHLASGAAKAGKAK